MIQITNLRRTFDDTVALRDLSLEVPAGELFGFLGRNGAGEDKISEHSPLPVHLQEGFALITAWQLLAMMMGSIHTMTFASNEAKNLTLLATAPISLGVLLRGKASVFLLPFLWSVLVVCVLLIGLMFGV